MARIALGAERFSTEAGGTEYRGLETGDILYFPVSPPLLPDEDRAFLVTQNFVVLKSYNNSDAYALAVAEIADRLRGRGPIRAAWPADDVQPSREERIALQRKLAALGYPVQEFNGHLDFALRDNIRDMQRKFGLIADGHPSRLFLARLGLVAN